MAFTKTRYGLKDGKIPLKEVIEYLEVGERAVVETDPRLSTVPGHEGKSFLFTFTDPLVDVDRITNKDKPNTVYGIPLSAGVVEISEAEYGRLIAGEPRA